MLNYRGGCLQGLLSNTGLSCYYSGMRTDTVNRACVIQSSAAFAFGTGIPPARRTHRAGYFTFSHEESGCGRVSDRVPRKPMQFCHRPKFLSRFPKHTIPCHVIPAGCDSARESCHHFTQVVCPRIAIRPAERL